MIGVEVRFDWATSGAGGLGINGCCDTDGVRVACAGLAVAEAAGKISNLPKDSPLEKSPGMRTPTRVTPIRSSEMEIPFLMNFYAYLDFSITISMKNERGF